MKLMLACTIGIYTLSEPRTGYIIIIIIIINFLLEIRTSGHLS